MKRYAARQVDGVGQAAGCIAYNRDSAADAARASAGAHSIQIEVVCEVDNGGLAWRCHRQRRHCN